MATLSEIHPSPKSARMTSTNLNDAEKQLVINIDGVRYTLSPRLTDDFRKKKVSFAQLGEYEVREVEGKNGIVFNSLGYPSEDITIKLDGWKSAKTERKVVSVEELMELVVF